MMSPERLNDLEHRLLARAPVSLWDDLKVIFAEMAILEVHLQEATSRSPARTRHSNPSTSTYMTSGRPNQRAKPSTVTASTVLVPP